MTIALYLAKDPKGRCFIGTTTLPPEQIVPHHLALARAGDESPISIGIRYYGETGVEFVLLREVEEEQADYWKAVYIKQFNADHIFHHKRTKVYGYNTDTAPVHQDSKRRRVIAVSPKGERYVVGNVKKFCQEHALNERLVYKVLAGVRNHTHGWKMSYEDEHH